jgi:RecA-family ATPase
MPNDDVTQIDVTTTEQPAPPAKPQRKFIVDRYLPEGFMHLIAAPVGMGKTTVLCQLVHATETGELWFGERAYQPAGVLFISADRDREETAETLERMGMPDLKMRSVFTCDYQLVPYLERIIETESKPGDLVIVEPFMVFLRDANNKMGNINDYNQVFSYANRIKRVVRKAKVTLIASGHSAKAKKGEGYNLVRERTLGSTAWSGAFSTIIYIDPTDPEDPLSNLRTITIFPRNKAGVQIECIQEEGHGLIVPIEMKAIKSPLDYALEALTEDTFTYADACGWAAAAGLQARTAERWLKESGRVVKITRGLYKRVNPS